MHKKSILVLICCGPCATHVLQHLNRTFAVTGYFYNPNIFPLEEYNRRIQAVQKTAAKTVTKVFFSIYDHNRWLTHIQGYENEPEGGKRCSRCFSYRLERTARFARHFSFDYFTSTLSVSPHKPAELINAIGEKFAQQYKVNYYTANFKKDNGFLQSCLLSKEWGLYRQNYCGCEFSIH